MSACSSAESSLDISLDALLHNLSAIRARAPEGTVLLPVVKDCAYSCGAIPVMRALESAGISFLVVARCSQARSLRAAGSRSTILVLGECNEQDAAWAVEHDIHLTVNDIMDIDRWNTRGIPVVCHLNIDTGMSRLGILPEEIDRCRAALSAGNVHLYGLFTHFSSADIPGTRSVDQQMQVFDRCIKHLSAHALTPRLIHTANSAALLRFPHTIRQGLRPGILLYGSLPDPRGAFAIDLEPVVTLKSVVAKMKTVSAGTPVSYGGTYTAPRDTVIATIPLGYAHGYPRALSNRGHLLIGGKRYQLAGRVTMDYCMVDAGPHPSFTVGDEVIALGRQESECITADELAVLCNTIGYEILCNLSSRLERRYFLHSRCIHHSPSCWY